MGEKNSNDELIELVIKLIEKWYITVPVICVIIFFVLWFNIRPPS